MAGTAAYSIMKIVIISGLVISALGLSEKEIQEMFKGADSDHDSILRLSDLTHIFETFDKDGDHFYTNDELLESKPNEEGTAFFNFFDKLDGTADHKVAHVVDKKTLEHLDEDKNGEIPYSEFEHSYPLFYAEVMKEKRVLAHW